MSSRNQSKNTNSAQSGNGKRVNANGRTPQGKGKTRRGKGKSGAADKSYPVAIARARGPTAGSKIPQNALGDESVLAWAHMVLNPAEAKVVRSPGISSALCSVTRLVESKKIAYSDTLNGYYTIIARPSAVFPLIIAKNPERFPAVGNAQLSASTISWQFSADASDPGYPKHGTAIFSNANDKVSVQVTPQQDSTVTVHNALNLFLATGTNLTVACVNKGTTAHYIKIVWRTNGGAWVTGHAPSLVAAGGSAVLGNFGSIVDYSALSFVMTTQAGVPSNPENDNNNFSFSFSFTGNIPVAADAGSVANFIAPSLAQNAQVTHCRVTAMSLLVTNLGSATHDGGEIVGACTQQANVYSAHTTEELMQRIKQLPETNRWTSRVTREGFYSYYVPDDAESYEPHSYDTVNFDDNCVVACGQMEPDGSLRVSVTYVVEFYTKVQLFMREMGPSWNQQYHLAHKMLQQGVMASGNENHETMTRRIMANLGKAWTWALAHRKEIEMGASLAVSLL